MAIEGTTVTMTGCALKGNTASNGGGIFVDKNYIVTLKGSVQVIGNKAGRGGGVYANMNSTFTMYDSSISNNTGTTGKGVYLVGGTSDQGTQDAVFIMGGAACVGKWVAGTLQDGNDVYLGENGGSGNLVSIKIDKDKPITQPKAARITPKNHAPMKLY